MEPNQETNQTETLQDNVRPDLEAVNQKEADAFYGTPDNKELEKPQEENNNSINSEEDTSNSKEEEAQSDSSSDSEGSPDSEDPNKDEVAKKDEKKENDSEEGEFKLSLGENSNLDEADLEAIRDFAVENGLTEKAAQNLLDMQDKVVAEIFQSGVASREAEVKEWIDTIKADPEIGGDNLRKTSESARRVLDRFGNQGFIEFLDSTGYGNHPDIVRFLYNIGKTMSEDTLVLGGKETSKPRSVEDIFYGN